MNKKISDALITFKKTRSSLLDIAKKEQKKCSHPRIIHLKWRSGEYFGPFKARRLCLECGLEQEARNSGWGDDDCDFPTLKSKGFHKIVDSTEFYRSRIGELPVDDNPE